MAAIIIIVLWIGSAVAGWFTFWPWLMAPIAFAVFHILRVRSGMRAARKMMGMPARGSGQPGTSMAGADAQLLIGTLLQHLAIFGIGAGLHWLIG